MLKNLFIRTKYFNDYLPQVRDILYPIAMIGVGYAVLSDNSWQGFGLIMIIGGVLFGIVIITGVAWRGPIAYWEQIERTVETMRRVNNPAVWSAMGFRELPEVVTVQEKRYDDHGAFQGMTVKKLPIEPEALNAIANMVVMNKDIDFTEEKYGSKVKNYRKVKKILQEKGYIVPKNARNVRGGYCFNKLGYDFIIGFADEMVLRSVKKEEKEKGEGSATEK